MISPDQKHLIFFADPMCSWCWGFAPVIEKLRADFDDQLPIKLVMGGLRIDQMGPMEDRVKAEVKTHWNHVIKTTGQPFNFDFFDQEKFFYDTEKSCQAVVTMRRLYPEEWQKPLDYMLSIHKAFYVEGQDTTKEDVLFDLASSAGVDRDVFKAEFERDETSQETRMDFMITQQAGVQGFPSVMAGSENEGFMGVSAGYSDYDAIAKPITDWFKG